MAKDLGAGIVLLVLAGAYWLGADAIQISRLSGGAGAQLLPKALAAALALLSVGLIVQALLKRRAKRAPASPADVDDDSLEDTAKVGRALGLLLIGIAYVLLIETLGYIVSSALLLGGTAFYMGWRRWRPLALFAVIGAILLWITFVLVLDLPLPAGFWPSLWPAG